MSITSNNTLDPPTLPPTNSQSFQLGFDEIDDTDFDLSSIFSQSSTSAVTCNESRDLLKKMKSYLPSYITNCFLAAGFDSAEVIASMDLSTKLGNSLYVMENYINGQFPGDEKYTHMGSKQCKFPPGHKIRIEKFVEAIRRDIKSKDINPQNPLNRKRIGGLLPFKSNEKKMKQSTSNHCDPSNMYKKARNAFVKWQRLQGKNIQALKEHIDYQVNVKVGTLDEHFIEVRCKCGACIKLQCTNENVIISNWTRHILKNCQGTKNSSKQHIVTKYLSNFSPPICSTPQQPAVTSLSLSTPSDGSSSLLTSSNPIGTSATHSTPSVDYSLPPTCTNPIDTCTSSLSTPSSDYSLLPTCTNPIDTCTSSLSTPSSDYSLLPTCTNPIDTCTSSLSTPSSDYSLLPTCTNLIGTSLSLSTPTDGYSSPPTSSNPIDTSVTHSTPSLGYSLPPTSSNPQKPADTSIFFTDTTNIKHDCISTLKTSSVEGFQKVPPFLPVKMGGQFQ